MKTTIDIAVPLFERARRLAERDGTTLRAPRPFNLRAAHCHGHGGGLGPEFASGEPPHLLVSAATRPRGRVEPRVRHEREVGGFRTFVGAAVVLMLAVSGCRRDESTYVPGLGEIMTLNQMRHAKLWFAGQAGNWPLAAYEVDELEEGFEAAVRFHPTHKDSPVSIAEVVPVMTSGPVKDLRAAIDRRDPIAFTEAFDALTTACNGCHQATNFGFNVVTRPAGNAFLNQNFAPPAAVP